MSGRSIHLIDRDELLATLEQDIDVSVTGAENMKAVQKCLQEIMDDVKESPVVDVIWCRECKYFTGHNCDRIHGMATHKYDFCSRAERKEHETD